LFLVLSVFIGCLLFGNYNCFCLFTGKGDLEGGDDRVRENRKNVLNLKVAFGVVDVALNHLDF